MHSVVWVQKKKKKMKTFLLKGGITCISVYILTCVLRKSSNFIKDEETNGTIPRRIER